MSTVMYSINQIVFGLENWIDISCGRAPTARKGNQGGLQRKRERNPMESSLILLADINRAISQLAIDANEIDRWACICQLQPEGCRMRCRELTYRQQKIVYIYIFAEQWKGYWKNDCRGILTQMKRFLNGETRHPNQQHYASIQRGRDEINRAIKDIEGNKNKGGN